MKHARRCVAPPQRCFTALDCGEACTLWHNGSQPATGFLQAIGFCKRRVALARDGICCDVATSVFGVGCSSSLRACASPPIRTWPRWKTRWRGQRRAQVARPRSLRQISPSPMSACWNCSVRGLAAEAAAVVSWWRCSVPDAARANRVAVAKER